MCCGGAAFQAAHSANNNGGSGSDPDAGACSVVIAALIVGIGVWVFLASNKVAGIVLFSIAVPIAAGCFYLMTRPEKVHVETAAEKLKKEQEYERHRKEIQERVDAMVLEYDAAKREGRMPNPSIV